MWLRQRRGKTSSHLLCLSLSTTALFGPNRLACGARRPSRRRLPFGLPRGGSIREDDTFASPYDAARSEFQAYVASAVDECRSTAREQLRRVEQDVANILQRHEDSVSTKGGAGGNVGTLQETNDNEGISRGTDDSLIDIEAEAQEPSPTCALGAHSKEASSQPNGLSTGNDAVLSSFTMVQNSDCDSVASEVIDALEPSTTDGQWTVRPAAATSGLLGSESSPSSTNGDGIANLGAIESGTLEKGTNQHNVEVETSESPSGITVGPFSAPCADAFHDDDEAFHDAIQSPLEERSTAIDSSSTIPLPPNAEVIAGDQFYDADVIPNPTTIVSSNIDPVSDRRSTDPAKVAQLLLSKDMPLDNSSSSIGTIPLPPPLDDDVFFDAKSTASISTTDPSAELDEDEFHDAVEHQASNVASTINGTIPTPSLQFNSDPTDAEKRKEVDEASNIPGNERSEVESDRFFDASQGSSLDDSDVSMEPIRDSVGNEDELFEASSSDFSTQSPIITNLSEDRFFDANELVGADDQYLQSYDEQLVDSWGNDNVSEVPQRSQETTISRESSGEAFFDAQEPSNSSLGVEIEMSTYTRNKNVTAADNVSGTTPPQSSSSKDYFDTFLDASQGVDFVVGDTDEEDEAVVGRLEAASKAKSKPTKRQKRTKQVQPGTGETQTRKKTKRRKAKKTPEMPSKSNATVSVDKTTEEVQAKHSNATVQSKERVLRAAVPTEAKAVHKKPRKKAIKSGPDENTRMTRDQFPASNSSLNRKLQPNNISLDNETGKHSNKFVDTKKGRITGVKSGATKKTSRGPNDSSNSERRRKLTRKKRSTSSTLADPSPAATAEKPRSILKTSPSLAASKNSQTANRKQKKVRFSVEDTQEEAPVEFEATKRNFSLGNAVLSVLLTIRFLLSAAFLLWIATTVAKILMFLGLIQ